jgi:Rps23 Pro-64 3,4-dihydroxylase Tpa1-like proline 4-hydroxylase
MLSKSKHFFSVGPFHESAAKCEQFLNNLQGLALYMETIEQLILLKDKESVAESKEEAAIIRSQIEFTEAIISLANQNLILNITETNVNN